MITVRSFFPRRLAAHVAITVVYIHCSNHSWIDHFHIAFKIRVPLVLIDILRGGESEVKLRPFPSKVTQLCWVTTVTLISGHRQTLDPKINYPVYLLYLLFGKHSWTTNQTWITDAFRTVRDSLLLGFIFEEAVPLLVLLQMFRGKTCALSTATSPGAQERWRLWHRNTGPTVSKCLYLLVYCVDGGGGRIQGRRQSKYPMQEIFISCFRDETYSNWIHHLQRWRNVPSCEWNPGDEKTGYGVTNSNTILDFTWQGESEQTSIHWPFVGKHGRRLFAVQTAGGLR